MSESNPTPDQGDERRAMTAAYLAFCADKAPDHNEVGFPYFKAAWQARAAQPVAQPVVDQKTASVSDNGSCSSQVSDKPVAQEANVKVGGSTVYVTNNHRRESNRWWATVYPGFDDDDKRVSTEECDAIARKIADALNAIAAPHRPVSAEPDRYKRALEAIIANPGGASAKRIATLALGLDGTEQVSAEAGKGSTVVVPWEPTTAMVNAGQCGCMDNDVTVSIYKAMLAASPSESVAVSAAPMARSAAKVPMFGKTKAEILKQADQLGMDLS